MKNKKLTNSTSGDTEGNGTLKKVKNSLNYVSNDGRTFTQPSMTIPDQTISIKELVSRFAKGLPIAEGKTPIYDESGESEGIDLRKLDLSEIYDLKKQVEWKIENAYKQTQKQKDLFTKENEESQKQPEGQ